MNIPKMLGTTRGMKSWRPVIPLRTRNTGTSGSRSIAGDFPVRVIVTQRGKPHRAPDQFFRESASARTARARGGKGWRRKPTPACNGPDRARSGQCDGSIARRESVQTSAGSFVARESGGLLNMGTPRNESARSCAPVDVDAQTWDEIDWTRCAKNVKKLQMRIAKAFREGKVAKAKYLQRLLTRSLSAKRLAVKRVTENRGKNTPGVDKVVWKTPEAKMKALRTLKRRGYTALPLRRVNIPKTNGKLRPLGIPTMKDRAMQGLHALALLPIAEETADPNSYGFRPLRSTADAIEQCFRTLSRKTSAAWVLEGDITGCFDNFSHDWLLRHVPMDKTMLQKWLTAGFIDQRHLHPTLKGTPQGGIMMPRTQCITFPRMRLGGGDRPFRRRPFFDRPPANGD